MPVTPTWQPPGENTSPAYVGDGWFIRYDTAGLNLGVSYADPANSDVHPEGDGTPITMLGLPGRRYRGVVGESPVHTLYVVTNDRGLSVTVWGYDPDVVGRFADGLVWEPAPVRQPFDLALAPAGLVPGKVTSYAMEFALSTTSGYFGVLLWQSYEFDRPPSTIDTTVGGYPAEVAIDRDLTHIRVLLPDGRVLAVQASADVGLDQRDLERIAAGITITEHATAWTNTPP